MRKPFVAKDNYKIPKRYQLVHYFCMYNRGMLERKKYCGCFYCIRTFHVDDIIEWVDFDQTAICPYCGIDSVIASTNEKLLEKMSYYWFNHTEFSLKWGIK